MLVFLNRKKLIKVQFKILFVGWLTLVLVFAGIIYAKTESAGDRTQKAVEHCQASSDPTCEY
jgi:hypothetical protein